MLMDRLPSVIVGVTGASGQLLAWWVVQALLEQTDYPIDLVLSQNAVEVWQHEMGDRLIPNHPRVTLHPNSTLASPIASGSCPTIGMLVAPCSVGTLGRIATGTADTLLLRAADVTLKERRPLVLMVRETPLNLIHLRAMQAVIEAGGVVMPPVFTLYNHPASLDDMARELALHAVELLGVRVERKRWGYSV